MKMPPQSSQQYTCHQEDILNTAVKHIPTQSQKRLNRYTTVTLLSELLANEKDCVNALWQRTH